MGTRGYGESDRMDNLFEEIVSSSMGWRGLVNKVKNKAIMKGYHYIKDNFGFDANINSSSKFIEVCEYLGKVSGVNIISTNKVSIFPAINIDRVFKLDYNTFCYISWDHEDNNKECPGYVYIFGRKSFKYYNYIYQNILDSKFAGSNSTVIYTIYANQGGDDWQGIRKEVPARGFNTLYFDNDIEQTIKSHIDTWLSNKDTYSKRGITFKTGILLYGSSGTGKSSIAATVADYLNCNIILIDMATFKDLNINEVTASINADDRMYVVLLDDIDTILVSRDYEGATTDDKATVAKLLSFLDSSNSPNNVIFIATTNYVERIDFAIKRSGRFDRVIEVENISRETAMKMCKGFGLSDQDSKKVVNDIIVDNRCNPSMLQARIIDTIKDNINNQ